MRSAAARQPSLRAEGAEYFVALSARPACPSTARCIALLYGMSATTPKLTPFLFAEIIPHCRRDQRSLYIFRGASALDGLAAHRHFIFTARAAVRCDMAHRFIRGRRFEPPVRRHLMSEQESACRASGPCDPPPALRDALHRRWTATVPDRDRDAWAPRIEGILLPQQIDPESTDQPSRFMLYNVRDQRPREYVRSAPRAQN